MATIRRWLAKFDEKDAFVARIQLTVIGGRIIKSGETVPKELFNVRTLRSMYYGRQIIRRNDAFGMGLEHFDESKGEPKPECELITLRGKWYAVSNNRVIAGPMNHANATHFKRTLLNPPKKLVRHAAE